MPSSVNATRPRPSPATVRRCATYAATPSGQRLQFPVHRDALPHLAQVRQGERLTQVWLTDQHDLQQLPPVLEVRQDADLFEQRCGQVLQLRR